MGGVVWAALLEVPIVVQGKGLLLSVHGIAEITMPSRGTLTRLPIHEGSDVKPGDLVALVAQPEARMQLTTKRALLREAQERLARHLDLDRRINDAQSAVSQGKGLAVESGGRGTLIGVGKSGDLFL